MGKYPAGKCEYKRPYQARVPRKPFRLVRCAGKLEIVNNRRYQKMLNAGHLSLKVFKETRRRVDCEKVFEAMRRFDDG